MRPSLAPIEDNSLCPVCNKRDFFCDNELFVCDCCSCMPELCSSLDHNEVVSPTPQPQLKLVV